MVRRSPDDRRTERDEPDYDDRYLDDRAARAWIDEQHGVYDGDEDLDTEPERRTGAHGPNYLARRGLVVAAISILVGIGALVAYFMLRTQDEPLIVDAPVWNSIAVVDRISGEIRLADLAPILAGGEELDPDTFVALEGAQRVDRVDAAADHLALSGIDGVELIDVVTRRRIEIPLERNWETRRLNDTAALVLAAAPDPGGNVVIINGLDGRQLDIAVLAQQRDPLLLVDSIRSDAQGRAFAIGDGRNFQTIVVGFDAAEAVFFPGAPMAVSDELVVTSATVGRSAELGLFDRQGERRAAISTDRPVGGVIDAERFVYITEDGRVLAVAPGSGEPQELGLITVPAGDGVRSVHTVAAGERLVARGDRFVALLDLNGEQLYTAPLSANAPQPTTAFEWRCLAVVDDEVVIVDIVDGAVLNTTTLEPSVLGAVSNDGCALVLDDRIVSATGTVTLDRAVRSVTLAPDASAAVTTTSTGAAELLLFGEQARTIDLGTLRGIVTLFEWN